MAFSAIRGLYGIPEAETDELKKRSDGALKRYQSETDARSWTMDKNVKSMRIWNTIAVKAKDAKEGDGDNVEKQLAALKLMKKDDSQAQVKQLWKEIKVKIYFHIPVEGS